MKPPSALSCDSCRTTWMTFHYDEAANMPSIDVEKGATIRLNHDNSKGTLCCTCGAEIDLTQEQLFFFLTVGGQ